MTRKTTMKHSLRWITLIGYSDHLMLVPIGLSKEMPVSRVDNERAKCTHAPTRIMPN